MTIVKKQVQVPYTTAEMYELVNGIEHYPAFLPWCKSTTIHSRTADEVRASIEVAKGGVHHAFSTINRLQQNKLIEVRLLKGPFRQLEGCWRFESLEGGGSEVLFDLEFEFSSKLVTLAIGPLLNTIAHSFVDAFCQRAKDVYGESPTRP